MSAPPAPSAETRCSRCRSLLEPGARFCGECGERLERDAAVTEERAVSPSAVSPSDGWAAGPGPIALASEQPQRAQPSAIEATPRPSAAPASIVASAAPVHLAPGSAKGAAPATLPKPVSMPPPSPPVYAHAKTVDRLLGRTLNNRYVVEKKIGEGGFGAVFKGKQIATGRDVALKILHPHNVGDPTVVARFRREAEACSKLRDPHTVITYDFDETEDGVLYLVMELLQGKSLQQIERAEGPLDGKRVLGILDQVAQSLGEAHAQGIVHRDMKPENVMIERRGDTDLVKVLDFGIAKVLGGATSKAPALTAIGQTVGTLEFMSPEQLRGRDLDGRSDIYALGMMAYEMLTGELPFKNAKSSTEVIEFHLQKVAPPPSQLRPDLEIPSYVNDVILKMVAKSPDERYPDVESMRRHIAEALAASDHRASRKELVRVVAVVGGILLLIGMAVLLLSR